MTDDPNSEPTNPEWEKLLAKLPPEHAAFAREQNRLAPPQTDEQIRGHQAQILASRRRRQDEERRNLSD